MKENKREQPGKGGAAQRRENVDQNSRRIADKDIADGGVVAVVIAKNRQLLKICSDDVRWQHQQRLAKTVPVVELAAAPVNAEFGIFIGENCWFRRPKRMRSLQTMHGVCRT